MPNSLRIDLLNLRRDQANIFTLKKRQMTNLNRDDRQCDEREDYNWRTCLDQLFYTYKGCQDPWQVNPGVDLPVCSNISYILGHTYGRPPLHISYDGEFADRPYKAEQELNALMRDGLQCSPPCGQTQFDTVLTFKPRDRYIALSMSLYTIHYTCLCVVKSLTHKSGLN